MFSHFALTVCSDQCLDLILVCQDQEQSPRSRTTVWAMKTADPQAEAEVQLEQRVAVVARDPVADPQTAGVHAAETQAAAEPTAAAKALERQPLAGACQPG